MALPQLMMICAVLLLALVEFSTCALLNGSVTCLDCHGLADLSDIKVVVKCSQVKKLAVVTTAEDGTFKTELPSDTPTAAVLPPPSKCVARIVGGPSQLYGSRNSMVSKIVKTPESEIYTLSAPLKFHTMCPLSNANCGGRSYTANTEIASSKTIDLPQLPEWGLAPPSTYVPFLPIIGIP